MYSKREFEISFFYRSHLLKKGSACIQKRPAAPYPSSIGDTLPRCRGGTARQAPRGHKWRVWLSV